MRQIISYWQHCDRLLTLPLLFSLLSALMILFPLLVFYNNLPSSLPLFYSLPWGQDQLVTKDQFSILPATVILITVTNSLLAFQLHQSQILLKRMLMVNLVLVDMTALVTALKILSIFI